MTTERFARQSALNSAKRLVPAGWPLLACLLFLGAAAAHAQAGDSSSLQQQKIAQLNVDIAKWSQDNAANFTTYSQYAHHEPKCPAIPVPPQIDPPCHACGDDTETPSETEVDNWIKQVTEPETTYIKGLLTMGRFIEVDVVPWGPDLTSATQRALKPFYMDPADYSTDANTMAAALVGKVEEMANHYKNDPTRAYAGIKCLLAEEQSLEVLAKPDSFGHNQTLAEYDYSKKEQQYVIQLAADWAAAVVNTMDDSIFKNHKYNLCPVYASLVR